MSDSYKGNSQSYERVIKWLFDLAKIEHQATLMYERK